VARVQTAQRGIGKIPLPGIEEESEVDHPCRVTQRCVAQLRITPRRVAGRWRTGRARGIAGLAKKNRLPAIRVAGPLVEDQNAEEIRKIPGRAQLLIGQKIVNRHPGRMSRELRSELLSHRARFLSEGQLNHKLRRVRDDFQTHFDHFDLRHDETQPRRQTCCKHFVR
jgi:hypothetical protein